MGQHGRFDLGPAMTDHHYGAFRRQRRAGVHGMDDQRRPPDRVQHLRALRVHPRALSRGEDDEGASPFD